MFILIRATFCDKLMRTNVCQMALSFELNSAKDNWLVTYTLESEKLFSVKWMSTNK